MYRRRDLARQVCQTRADIFAGFFHTCAINEFNELRCWGNNDAGQLGQGHTNTLGDNEAILDIPPVSVF